MDTFKIAELADRLASADMVAAVSEAISRSQATTRVEHTRRIGSEARHTLAAAILDTVCEELGVPTSVDRLIGSSLRTYNSGEPDCGDWPAPCNHDPACERSER